MGKSDGDSNDKKHTRVHTHNGNGTMQASKGQKSSNDDEMLPTINLFLTEYFNVSILWYTFNIFMP